MLDLALWLKMKEVPYKSNTICSVRWLTRLTSRRSEMERFRPLGSCLVALSLCRSSSSRRSHISCNRWVSNTTQRISVTQWWIRHHTYHDFAACHTIVSPLNTQTVTITLLYVICHTTLQTHTHLLLLVLVSCASLSQSVGPFWVSPSHPQYSEIVVVCYILHTCISFSPRPAPWYTYVLY